MKTQIIFFLSMALTMTGCIVDDNTPGPQGPQGPQGPEGAPGESGYIFEYEGVNFTAPNYEVLLDYPQDFQPLDSDVNLTYLLWGVETINGEDVLIWRLLPQTIFTQFGLLQYNYDFTKYDVRLFLDGDFSLDQLTANETDAWVVRVVIVPGSFWNAGGKLNASDYYAVAKTLGLPDLTVQSKIINR